MRKLLKILCMVGICVALLSGCSGGNDKDEQAPAENEIINDEAHITEDTPTEKDIIIKEVHVTEESLSAIIIDEEVLYADTVRNWD
ncbi:MAG: hypothetical protein IJP17_07990, partial [Clostridia bacterium]|nr:hypothetical protein [Clostridia bacterium]